MSSQAATQRTNEVDCVLENHINLNRESMSVIYPCEDRAGKMVGNVRKQQFGLILTLTSKQQQIKTSPFAVEIEIECKNQINGMICDQERIH